MGIKISQLTAKGSNLAATDLLEIAEVSGLSYVSKRITGQQILNAASTLTVGTTAVANGTIGRVLFQGTGNVLQQSANLFWDNSSSRLGIGTAAPNAPVHVASAVTASGGVARTVNVTNTLTASANNNILVALDIAPTFDAAGFTNVTNLALRVSGTIQGATGSWDSTGLSINNIRRSTSATLQINSDGGILNSLQFTATSGWGSISSGTVNGMYNSMGFAGTGTSNFNNFNFTGNHNSSTSGEVNIIAINTAITTSNAGSIVRGIYYNPTISIAGTHRAIQTVTGNVIFNSTSGNVAIGGTSFGSSSDKVLAQYNGTAPGSSPTDAFQMYSADIVGGNAAPHFRTENGNVVKLYQETTAVAAATFVSNTSLIANDTATFDGYTIGQVVKALRNLGILA